MVFSSTARVSLPEFRFPSFASGSQKIGDFLGVALQVQQHEVLFASLPEFRFGSTKSFSLRSPSFASGARSPFRFAQEDEFAKMRLRTM